MTTDRLPFADASTRLPARPAREVLTVTELTARIRLRLESAYPAVWVEGELSNCHRWKTGHLYFTLKDGGAQIRGVMFRSTLRYLRFEPADGQHVVARGRVSVYEPKGEYQLVAEHFEPVGVGARQLAFDRLRQRLEAEGLFDPARKRRLPALPRRIGVVTSLDGAALRDVLTVLARRFPGADVLIGPTRVQGDGAASEIAAALARVADVPAVDVVILTRGGGSMEDLWAFNDEALARAVAGLRVPVISAVGHQTDYTISDFVADVRAPTPSAAAELVVARKIDMEARIGQAAGRLAAALRDTVARRRTAVDLVRRRPGLASFPARIAMRDRWVDDLTRRLVDAVRGAAGRRTRRLALLRERLEALDVGLRLARMRTRLEMADARLARGMTDGATARRRRLEAVDARAARAAADRNAVRRRRLEAAAARLEALSPLGVLARGFAVCWNDDRTAIIRRARDVAAGETVRITLQEGELRCDVRESG